MSTLPTDRSILHLDLDSFFVSVERLRDSRLNNKPLIIGSFKSRGVVACCSYEARKFGVHAGMAGYLARQLCPEALFISGDMEAYSRYSRLITEILEAQAPLLEKASIDEFYLDLTGMDKFLGCYQWATELRQKVIKESGLPISLGLSVNKMISKMATSEAKPNGQRQVSKGAEQAFIDPMPIHKLPMIGDKTAQLLHSMGVRKVEVLRQMPVPMLDSLLGKSGIELWKRANAIDNSAIVPYHDPKSISTEDTFAQDSIDVKKIRAQLSAMTEKIAFQMRSEKKLAGCITVKIRYADFQTVSKQIHLSYTGCDALLIKQALALFDKLYERRQRIRLIGVRLSDLIRNSYQQLSLFEDTGKDVQLYNAIDEVKQRYGTKAVIRAFGLETGGSKLYRAIA